MTRGPSKPRPTPKPLTEDLFETDPNQVIMTAQTKVIDRPNLVECLERMTEGLKLELTTANNRVYRLERENEILKENAGKVEVEYAIDLKAIAVWAILSIDDLDFNFVFRWIKFHYYNDYSPTHKIGEVNYYFSYDYEFNHIYITHDKSNSTLGAIYFPIDAKVWIPELQRILDSGEVSL